MTVVILSPACITIHRSTTLKKKGNCKLCRLNTEVKKTDPIFLYDFSSLLFALEWDSSVFDHIWPSYVSHLFSNRTRKIGSLSSSQDLRDMRKVEDQEIIFALAGRRPWQPWLSCFWQGSGPKLDTPVFCTYEPYIAECESICGTVIQYTRMRSRKIINLNKNFAAGAP